MPADWTAVLVAGMAAGASTYTAWSSTRNRHQVATLETKVVKVAEAKVLADARLASAALSAIAHQVRPQDPALSQVAAAAAEKVLSTAEVTAADLALPQPPKGDPP